MTLLKTAAALLLAAAAFGSEGNPINSLVAHEWGTFTSVAGKDGKPLQWQTLGGEADLPCFVIRRGGLQNVKTNTFALVRMETPVLYFYSPRPTSVSVRVDLPGGVITEWYPGAVDETGPAGRISWNNVEVLPGASLEFPNGKGPSHYYAARNTDAAPLRVGAQQEKLLFYRGLANFLVPVEPRFTSGGKIEIRNSGAGPIPAAILFENRQGKTGYRVIEGGIRESVQVEPPQLTGGLDRLHRSLAATLVEMGLFGKEAQAMIETWRDSWFEEGMRVLYVMPRSRVDTVLPLAISPEPNSLARVFVGRVELLSPTMENSIATALSRGDIGTLRKYGRFLSAFVPAMGKVDVTPEARYFLNGQAGDAARQYSSPACVQ